MTAQPLRPEREPAAATLPAAVLWDMDGTLVDTEPSWIECERELVARFGNEWTEEDAHALVGNPLLVSATILRERGGVPLAPEVIVEELLDCVVARVRAHVPFRPGAKELLTARRPSTSACEAQQRRVAYSAHAPATPRRARRDLRVHRESVHAYGEHRASASAPASRPRSRQTVSAQ